MEHTHPAKAFICSGDFVDEIDGRRQYWFEVTHLSWPETSDSPFLCKALELVAIPYLAHTQWCGGWKARPSLPLQVTA